MTTDIERTLEEVKRELKVEVQTYARIIERSPDSVKLEVYPKMCLALGNLADILEYGGVKEIAEWAPSAWRDVTMMVMSRANPNRTVNKKKPKVKKKSGGKKGKKK